MTIFLLESGGFEAVFTRCLFVYFMFNQHYSWRSIKWHDDYELKFGKYPEESTVICYKVACVRHETLTCNIDVSRGWNRKHLQNFELQVQTETPDGPRKIWSLFKSMHILGGTEEYTRRA